MIPGADAWDLTLSASVHSPGLVENDETIGRLHFEPTHLDPDTKSLKPPALDDFGSHGLSVTRYKYRKFDEFVSAGILLAGDIARRQAKPRALAATSDVNVAEIRQLLHEGSRSLGVFDVAYEDDRAHAEVCLVIKGKAAFRSARSHLLDLCNKTLKLRTN